jgi:hypothetical protein
MFFRMRFKPIDFDLFQSMLRTLADLHHILSKRMPFTVYQSHSGINILIMKRKTFYGKLSTYFICLS